MEPYTHSIQEERRGKLISLFFSYRSPFAAAMLSALGSCSSLSVDKGGMHKGSQHLNLSTFCFKDRRLKTWKAFPKGLNGVRNEVDVEGLRACAAPGIFWHPFDM